MSTKGTTPEQLEADIARQREELADTVDQLQAKLDVKARVTERVTTDEGRPRPDLIAAAAVAVVLVGVLLWRRRR